MSVFSVSGSCSWSDHYSTDVFQINDLFRIIFKLGAFRLKVSNCALFGQKN